MPSVINSKNVLTALGVFFVLVGLLAVAGVDMGVEGPAWHIWAKIVVGAFAVYVGYT